MTLEVSIPCGACSVPIRLGEDRCSACGRAATPDELAALQRRWEAADGEIARTRNEVHHGRLVMIAAAGLWTLGGLAMWVLGDLQIAAPTLIVAALLVLFLATSFRWVLPSLVGAAVVVLVAWMAQLVASPLAALGAGALLKGLTLVGLGAGCAAELRLRRARESAR